MTKPNNDQVREFARILARGLNGNDTLGAALEVLTGTALYAWGPQQHWSIENTEKVIAAMERVLDHWRWQLQDARRQLLENQAREKEAKKAQEKERVEKA